MLKGKKNTSGNPGNTGDIPAFMFWQGSGGKFHTTSFSLTYPMQQGPGGLYTYLIVSRMRCRAEPQCWPLTVRERAQASGSVALSL